MKGIIIRNMLLVLLMILALPVAFAEMKLDNIQFDPAIIAAGDEVDIVVQFHHTSSAIDEDKIGDKDYTFKVVLEGDDTLTQNYVTIQDSEGDDLSGVIFNNDYYNKKFRVKVNGDAPAGNYEFKLSGQWYYKGEPLEGKQFLRFMMPVKKEGIILDINTLETVPSEVRPGDDYVKVITRIENVGEKDAKSVEVNLNLPKGVESSYTNNNRVWVGRVNAGESKEVTFFLNVDEKVESGVYDLAYEFRYMDEDNNKYEKKRIIPFLIRPRPYLEVTQSIGKGFAGTDAKLYVKIKNTGEESAESVDVRILKQNSQPFTLDVRSDYIGELEPGEEGLAIFDISINPDAEIKEHYFKLLIRSKGDSDEGDDTIYTYNRRAEFNVIGKAPNKLAFYGGIAVIIVVLALISNAFYKKKNKGGKK